MYIYAFSGIVSASAGRAASTILQGTKNAMSADRSRLCTWFVALIVYGCMYIYEGHWAGRMN